MSQNPGTIGWGVERPHLIVENKIITDDVRVPSYPIKKGHLKVLDDFRDLQFTKYNGDRAEMIDKKLGIDHSVYNTMNM